MRFLPLDALVGLLTGFLAAIPPGPLNVTIIRKASRGQVRDAYRVAAGGSVVDALFCGAIGLGFARLLANLFEQRWLKGALALILVAYGLKILLLDRNRDAELLERAVGSEPGSPAEGAGPPPARGGRLRLPFVVGFIQGVANPALLVNWTLITGFLLGNALIRPFASSAALFALGVGAGVFAWFALLIHILRRLHDHPMGWWLRRSEGLAGLLLVLFGLYFTFQSLAPASIWAS